MIRLYLSDTPDFAAGLSLILPPEQSRYLGAVMRKVAGDEISVFNGRDGEWTARIAEVGKKAVRIELTVQTRTQTTGQGPVLLIALVKRARMEIIVEKATELGASVIQPVITRRANADHTNVERLKLIAIEAAEQTERLDVPDIRQPVKLEKLDLSAYSALFFGDEDSTHEGDDKRTLPMLEAVNGSKAAAAAQASAERSGANPIVSAILIGPEGGFDDTERQSLRAMANVHPVNLGPRILRADTAAISALTLFQASAGDWR